MKILLAAVMLCGVAHAAEMTTKRTSLNDLLVARKNEKTAVQTDMKIGKALQGKHGHWPVAAAVGGAVGSLADELGFTKMCEDLLGSRCKGAENRARTAHNNAQTASAKLDRTFKAVENALAECKTAVDTMIESYGCNMPTTATAMDAMVVALDHKKKHCARLPGSGAMHLPNNQWVGFDKASDSVTLAEAFQTIENARAHVTTLRNRENTARADVENCFNGIQEDCDLGSAVTEALGAIGDAIAEVVAEIAAVIEAIIQAVACTVVEVGLAILGAVIDAALFASGVTAGMVNLPWFPIMCLDPTTDQGTAIQTFKDDNVNVVMSKATKAAAVDTLKGEAEGKLQSAYIQASVSGCIKDSSLGGSYANNGVGAGCEASLLQLGNNQTSTGQRSLARLRAGETVETGDILMTGVEFLFNFIMEVLKSTDLVSAEAAGIVETIFWILMRLWEGMCGQFGTAVMNVVKELALCNMCDLCPPSACTIKVFSFSQKCRDHYALLEGEATESRARVRIDALNPVGCSGSGCEYSAVVPADGNTDLFKDAVAVVSGNSGLQECDSWCRNKHWTGGAYGAIYTTVKNNAGQDTTLALFADGPLHRRSVGDSSTSPCCAAGGSNACNACTCKGPYYKPPPPPPCFSCGLLEVAEGMEAETRSTSMTSSSNCGICMTIVGQLMEEIKAGTSTEGMDPSTVFSLFKEECDSSFTDEESLQHCYSEIEPVESLTGDQLALWLDHYSPRDICSGNAEDSMVDFCRYGDSHVVTPL